jgi:hypothetical protein
MPETSRIPVISTAPPAIAFSRNAINLALNTTGYTDGEDVNSVNFLDFTGAVAADAVRNISWLLNGASMTAKADPDDSGYQFPTGDGGDAYVTGLVQYFQSNNFINDAYTVSVQLGGTHPRLVFTALEPGADYDFTDTNGGLSGVDTPGDSAEPLPNFAHHNKLYIEKADGSAFVQAASANSPLDFPYTGITSMDIGQKLDAYLAADRPVLDAAYAFCTNSVRRYLVLFAAYYGDTPFIHKATRSPFYHVALGGMSLQSAVARDLVTEFCPVAGHREHDRFMRQGMKNKLVSTDQPEWLTWINLTAGAVNAALQIVVYNDDNTTFPFLTTDNIAIAQYKKVQFACGYKQLGIAARQEGKNPIYYTATLLVAAAPVTDTYTFVIDYTFREFRRYLVYKNSYGAYQTIATIGRAAPEYDRTKDDGIRGAGQTVRALEGNQIEFNLAIQQKNTVSVGYRFADRRMVSLMRDFFLSDSIYEFDVAGNALIPVGLNTKTGKDIPDGANVGNTVIEYFYKNQDEVWTEPPGLKEVSVAQLLAMAGSPIPPAVSGGGGGGGGTGGGTGAVIPVEADDLHLSIVGGLQVYTAPILVGLPVGYRIYSTQMGLFFRTADIIYNAGAGSFTINVEGFVLAEGEQLIISPYVLNPDE